MAGGLWALLGRVCIKTKFGVYKLEEIDEDGRVQPGPEHVDKLARAIYVRVAMVTIQKVVEILVMREQVRSEFKAYQHWGHY